MNRSSFVATYQNHIVYCSAYVALLSFYAKLALQARDASEGGLSFFFCLYCLLASLSAWALKAEIQYLIHRRGLPPGDHGWPIIGHLPMMVKDPVQMYLDQIQKHGSHFTMNFLMDPVVVFVEEEDATWYMQQERKGNVLLPAIFPVLVKVVGEEAIMLHHGQNHRRFRKIMEPAFGVSTVKTYISLMDDTIQTELKVWSDSNKFQTSEQLSFLAMKIFFVCAFGRKDIAQSTLKEISDLIKVWTKGFYAITAYEIPGSIMAKSVAAKKRLYEIVKTLIDEFKAKFPAGDEYAMTTLMGRFCYSVDEDGNTLTEDQLIQNVLFLVFAGHDTTRATMSSLFVYLSRYPEAREHLVEEVKGLHSLDALNHDELKNAPILNAFIAETWRTTSPTFHHLTRTNMPVEYKGSYIPKGTVLSFAIAAPVLTNEKRYPQPKEFRIERWLPKDHPLHDPSWAPEPIVDYYHTQSVNNRTFNAGPHACLGVNFAKLETRMLLVRLIESYNLEIRNDRLEPFPLRTVACEFKVTPKKDL